MTTGIPPSIILYPDASSIHGSSPASVLSSSLLHVLQLFTTQYNFASTLHLYSAMLGFVGLAYAVILSIFRLLFFECDSISDCLLQMSFCVLLILAQSCSGNLSESEQLIANMVIAVAASAFIWWLHKHYVSGRKYKSSNVDGRVYIITGSNAGTLARCIYQVYFYCHFFESVIKHISMTFNRNDSASILRSGIRNSKTHSRHGRDSHSGLQIDRESSSCAGSNNRTNKMSERKDNCYAVGSFCHQFSEAIRSRLSGTESSLTRSDQ